MSGWIFFAVGIIAAITFAFNRASLSVWTTGIIFFLIVLFIVSDVSVTVLLFLWASVTLILLLLNYRPWRRYLLSRKIFSLYIKYKPSLSDTEQAALAAGHVGWEGECFTGMPDWNRYSAIQFGQLSEEEAVFLNDTVSRLCAMIDDWEINHRSFKIPQTIWKYLKRYHFFGLMIPKEYGGHGFSAFAYFQIITKISSVSTAVGTVVSVPNSLGPAELLLHYGLKKQKDYYLPRLVSGEEIPCFALTSPIAGSDAGAIIDQGIVCWHVFSGERQLAIKLNWNKRYITLAPVATLIGLAFKLFDPDHLLGDREYVGITCALIPADTKGVVSGRYHFPLHCAFPNGPIQGRDVFVPIDAIIGGLPQAGQGWRMLMKCLASGRALSLPAMVRGSAKRLLYASGAYARIREQFGRAIGYFGGVEEALANIGGYLFLMEGLSVFTTTLLDQGVHSAIASGISKYYGTEWSRCISNAAMDIHGGKAICMGPKNYIAQTYIETPIGITVEGANILMRSMIIFGQGLIRCHPYLSKEMAAAEDVDKKRGLDSFDRILFAHLGFFISNTVRTFILGLSNGRMTCTPSGKLKRYYRQLSRYSAIFALISDIAVGVLGKRFKKEEKLSGRLADIFSFLYIASAVMKYYDSFSDSELRAEAIFFVRWACDYLFHELQESVHGVLMNMPKRWIGRFLYRIIFPWGKSHALPTDRLGARIASLLLNPSHIRAHLSEPAYIAQSAHHPMGKLAVAFTEIIAAEKLEKKVYSAARKKLIKTGPFEEMAEAAAHANILKLREKEQVLKAWQCRMTVTSVDDFSLEELASE